MQAAETLTTEHRAPFDLAALFDGLAGKTSVAIAVSGGSDSMGLLRLAQAWVSSPKITALTIDHSLRDGSADEATQVAAWCDDLGIAHHVLLWEGEKPSTGIQAKARVARYDLLTDFCRAHGIGVLLTGHTMDDQAETVAMRAARTDSPAALAGIWPETTWNGVTVMRPLLGVRRQALREWLRDIGQDWIDDPSNDDFRFERVRVRKILNGADVDGLAKQADHARNEAEANSDAADEWIAKHVTRHPESHFSFDKVQFLQQPRLVRRLVFAKLVAGVGTGMSLSMHELERLVGFLGSGGRRTLGGALIAARLREVIMTREAGRIEPDWSEIGASGVLDWDRRFRVTAPVGSHVGPALLAPGLRRPERLPHYVFESCPVVRLADGQVVLAQNSGLAGVSATLL